MKDFCSKIKDINPIKALDNETVKYRLNSFIKVCNIDMETAVCKKANYEDANMIVFEYDEDDYIVFAISSNNEDGNIHNIIDAEYKGLKVHFYDSFSPSILKKGYRQIPVNITIEKIVDSNISYKLKILSTYQKIVEISIAKHDDINKPSDSYDYTYQCSINGFSDVLSLISQFIKDPQVFYNQRIKEVLRHIKIRLNAQQADLLLRDSDEFAEPKERGIFKKAIGTIFDRHIKK